ncbi:hypothetical protein [Actinomyces sp. zg296]|uniref:hypothetical protein n=1 Tax=Actinomyces sp. zg296 TaxID=2609289 RepID=UPI00135AB67A|nr:hypothetical protein [Actinomyces sp. zg296]
MNRIDQPRLGSDPAAGSRPAAGRHRRALVGVVLVTALAAAGLGACGIGGKEDVVSDTAAQAQPVDPAVAQLLDLTAANVGAKKPIDVSTELPSLDTRATSDQGTPLTVTLNAVTVSGSVTTVVFSATNNGKGGSSRWQVSDFFSDGERKYPIDSAGHKSENWGKSDNTDGVYITDTTNQKVYRTAYDTSGGCLCSGNLSPAFVSEGRTLVFQTSFAALPEGVSTVDVSIPGAGTFSNVKVTR